MIGFKVKGDLSLGAMRIPITGDISTIGFLGKIRVWVIRKLAGKSMVMINVSLDASCFDGGECIIDASGKNNKIILHCNINTNYKVRIRIGPNND